MDICAVISQDEINHNGDAHQETCDTLARIKREILNINFVKRVLLIKAVIPILQVQLQGANSGMNLFNLLPVYRINRLQVYGWMWILM